MKKCNNINVWMVNIELSGYHLNVKGTEIGGINGKCCSGALKSVGHEINIFLRPSQLNPHCLVIRRCCLIIRRWSSKL
jgi:hypothetical protein